MLRLFLAILEGRTPATARPILATEDEGIIRRVAQELIVRLAPRGDGSIRRERPRDDGSVGKE